MPYFIFHGVDKPDVEATRLRVRPDHQAWVKRDHPGMRVVAAGPLTDDADAHMTGTVLVFEADDRQAVERMLAGDPYVTEGIFSRTEVKRWRWSLGQPS